MKKNLLKAMLFGLVITAISGGAHAGKVRVCHDGKTLWINSNALQAHLNHGDVRGRCEDFKEVSAVVIFRCGVSSANGLIVTAVSSTLDLPVAYPQVVPTDNCADANATLIDHKFTLQNVTSGPVGADFETEYFYERKILRRRTH